MVLWSATAQPVSPAPCSGRRPWLADGLRPATRRAGLRHVHTRAWTQRLPSGVPEPHRASQAQPCPDGQAQWPSWQASSTQPPPISQTCLSPSSTTLREGVSGHSLHPPVSPCWAGSTGERVDPSPSAVQGAAPCPLRGRIPVPPALPSAIPLPLPPCPHPPLTPAVPIVKLFLERPTTLGRELFLKLSDKHQASHSWELGHSRKRASRYPHSPARWLAGGRRALPMSS